MLPFCRPVALATLVVCIGVGRVGAQSNTAAPQGDSGAATADAPTEWRFSWKDHPQVAFGDVARVEFRARFATTAKLDKDADDPSTFDLARRRMSVRGELWKSLEFQVEREFGDSEAWRDVFLNYRVSSALELQTGHFKLPFSLDETTGAGDLDFVYRSRAATELAPGRDRGVMAHGRANSLRYEFGVFRSAPDLRAHQPSNTTVATRVVVQPLRGSQSTFRDFQAGLAYTRSRMPEGVADLSGHTFGGALFLRPDIWLQGMQRRVGVESRWRPGPFSVQSEYIWLDSERLGQSLEGNDVPALVATGWYVSGTWYVTGEHKAGDGRIPQRPLFRGGYGAIELVARAEGLGFRSADSGFPPSTSPRAETILARQLSAMTFGVTWLPNRWVKIQGNLIRESLTNGSNLPVPAWNGIVNFQLSL